MINLEKLLDEEFINSTGAAFCATWNAKFNCLCLDKEIETYRRSLEKEDFPKIEKFVKELISDRYDPDYHFSHEITLIALAIILAEYETKMSSNFFTEVEALHSDGGNRSLPNFTRAGNYLSKLRDTLSPTKNKVRLSHPRAVFLPLNELEEALKELDKKLVIAAAVYIDDVALILNDYSEVRIQLSGIPDSRKPYLTDWGQTLGFGVFGTYEMALSRYI